MEDVPSELKKFNPVCSMLEGDGSVGLTVKSNLSKCHCRASQVACSSTNDISSEARLG